MKKIAETLFFLTILFLPAYLIRFTVFSVSLNILDILEVISIVSGLLVLFTSGKWREAQKWIQEKKWFISGFLLILLGSFISAYVSNGFQLQELGILKSWVVLPFLFIFLGYLCGFSFQRAFLWYIGSAIIVSLVSLGLPDSISVTYDFRLRGWYESPNQLALYIAPGLVFAWFLFRERGKFRKIFLFGSFGVLGALLWTQSLGAIISVFMAIFLGEFVFLKRKKYVYRWMYLSLLIGVIILNISFLKEIFISDRSSLSSREMIWTSALHIIEDNYIFGIGPGNFQEKYLEYQKFYPPYLEWAVPHPHNMFLAFWLYSGIVGLFGFFLVLRGMVIFFVKKATYLRRDHAPPFLGLCAFLAIMVYGLTDTVFWGNALSVIFWLVIFLSTEQDRKVC